jgi:hypothetical protein
MMRNNFLIDCVAHRLIRHFPSSSTLTIPSDIAILGSSCFSNCKSLSSISFEPDSRLKRIETRAFQGRCVSIVVPSTILLIAYDADQ